jgi:hypothetical protein
MMGNEPLSDQVAVLDVEPTDSTDVYGADDSGRSWCGP